MRSRLWLLLLLGSVTGAPQARVSSAAVVQLYQAGQSTHDIASAQGCSRRRVQQILAAAGLLLGLLPVHPHADQVIRFEISRQLAICVYVFMLCVYVINALSLCVHDLCLCVYVLCCRVCV